MIRSYLLIFSTILLSSFSAFKPSMPNAVLLNEPSPKFSIAMERFVSMKTREVERLLGRKLTFKEKLFLKIARYNIKKVSGSDANSSKGQTAFILSLLSLFLLIVPYGILFSIPLAIIGIVMGSKARRENRNDQKAKTAIILGTITLSLFILVVLLVVIWFATWSGGF